MMAHLLEANGPHFESECLMRFSVIHGIKVNKWQLSQFLSPYFEYRFGFCLFSFAAIQDNVWFVVLRSKLLIIITLQFDCIIVVS